MNYNESTPDFGPVVSILSNELEAILPMAEFISLVSSKKNPELKESHDAILQRVGPRDPEAVMTDFLLSNPSEDDSDLAQLFTLSSELAERMSCMTNLTPTVISEFKAQSMIIDFIIDSATKGPGVSAYVNELAPLRSAFLAAIHEHREEKSDDDREFERLMAQAFGEDGGFTA